LIDIATTRLANIIAGMDKGRAGGASNASPPNRNGSGGRNDMNSVTPRAEAGNLA